MTGSRREPWFKMPKMIGLKPRGTKASKAVSDKPWCNRHHILPSRYNSTVTAQRRLYFDTTPQVHIRAGKYEEVPVYQPLESDDPGGHEIRMEKRVKQFPTQLQGRKWRPPKTPVLTSLLPGFSQESKAGHLYTFPSWSGTVRQSPISPLEQHPLVDSLSARDRGESSLSDESRIQTIPESESLPQAIRSLSTEPSFRRTSTMDHPSNDGSSRRSRFGRRCSADSLKSFGDQPQIGAGLSSSLTFGLSEDKAGLLKHFQAWCEGKFGHMVSLWRSLDRDGNMTLSKTEFLTGLKKLNYGGRANALWPILDRDTTGLLSITEFVPQAAMDMARFRHWADITFGSVQKAFHAFDSDRNGKMTLREFIHGCQSNNFPAEFQSTIPTLFRLLDDNRGGVGKSVISADEIAFLDAWKCPEYLWAEPDDEAKEAFREALVAKHGLNYIIAWRKTLDKDSTMRVNFSEFIQTCKRLAKSGMHEAMPACGVGALFCAFDRNRRGWISLRDWHEQSFSILSNFKSWVLDQHSSVSDCFRAWNPDPAGMHLGEFRRHLRSMDIPSEHKEYLFEALSLEGEVWSQEKGRYAHGKLSRSEIVFLDAWLPADEAREIEAWDEQFGRAKPSDEQHQNDA